MSRLGRRVTAKNPLSGVIDDAVSAIRAEAVGSRVDAKRADWRGFRLLGADLYARADRLEQLAATLYDVRKGRPA
jgi:hypothetical protein